jgi:tRNA threonylcarbamoyl adenosine modification protein YjeE
MTAEASPSQPTSPPPSQPLSLLLPSPKATAALASALAPELHGGDVVLLEGPIGAGKTHFARALIQALLARYGRVEDVPSPTYTLVQTYHAGGTDIVHADLYRLSCPHDALELGLDEAFGTAICLVEWPDRLGTLAPSHAIRLRLDMHGDGEARIARIDGLRPQQRQAVRAFETAPA